MRLLILAATFGTAAFMPTVSSAQVFRSGERVVPLLELFTSEGCSSCPPAEHWLGELRHEPGLWRDFVPVAWHVNYWDRLGWPDQFADRAYTDRQYAYAKTWRSGRVYTPGFVRAGEEWRPSSGELGSSRNAMSGGELVASVERDQVLVRFESSCGWAVALSATCAKVRTEANNSCTNSSCMAGSERRCATAPRPCGCPRRSTA